MMVERNYYDCSTAMQLVYIVHIVCKLMIYNISTLKLVGIWKNKVKYMNKLINNFDFHSIYASNNHK